MSEPDGLLLVDKPAGWTSHDVVARVRRLAGTRRVGHAGTLDPMATGVLVLGVGRGTKLLTFLVGCDKAYAATVRLGQVTVTDDAAGEITQVADPAAVAALGPDLVAAAVARLTGPIQQVPSSVSAIRVDGQRAYARVRGGQDVALAARPVTVSRFEVLAQRPALTATGAPVLDLDIEVEVSSGTYVRALARDLGAALGVGGHLTALRRTRVGRYQLTDCHTMAALTDASAGGIPILPLAQAARAALTARELTDEQADALTHGRPIESVQPGRTEPVAGFGPDGVLVAVLDESAPRARTHVVFPPAGA